MLQAVVEQQHTVGRNPYLIPYGGSNVVGATAYVAALEEVAAQLAALNLDPFDRIVFASSSGGTHAGLAVGARMLDWSGEILGISIDKPLVELTNDTVAVLATETAVHLDLDTEFSGDEIRANADYLGGGYGVMGAVEREAIQLFAQAEGILLDPVYTSRAAAGLIDLIRTGVIGRQERVLFWHTGGLPALFAPQYSSVLAAHV